MMLDTADNKIYFPRFYDIDTICSYDNSGQLKFDVDIEMEQGYWNTSSSRLWTRIRDLMHDDIVTTYNNMRQNGVSYENMMKYIYDEQIAKIPQTYYNKDYDVKYAPFADSYIGMAHGDTYEHVKRWLKQRFTFVDTLFDYAPSYNNDVLTIRANTTELMTLEIETYTPVYQHVSWYNGQMDKKKIDGKVSVEFSGTAQAATDQEVLIYGGSNVKSIKGITSMNPNRMLIGSATKLVEIDAHDCPLLADINANKANLSPHEYLNKVNLSNCPLLEGNLKLNNSPLVQELDIRGTNITGMNLPGSIRNLQVLRLPNTMTELTLNDANMLHTLEFDEGVNLQSISMTNCNALENVTGFDLLQTPSITLNNSYNTVAELYFRDTTNLSLSNMPNLERVIFTPNNEYETFEMINVANAPDYKVTTFNCPKLSTFMTTAPYRESYNDCGMIDKTVISKNDVDLLENELNSYTLGVLHADTGEILDNPTSIVFNKYLEVVADCEYTLNAPAEIRMVCYDKDKKFISRHQITSYPHTLTFNSNVKYVRLCLYATTSTGCSFVGKSFDIIQIKDYGDIQPNTTFTTNTLDISNTQFTDVKLLCTTDTNTLKLPTTVKNFYCDSSFDLDTNYLEDGEYDVVHGELVEEYTTDYEGEVLIYNKQFYLIKDGNLTPEMTDNIRLASTLTEVPDNYYATSTNHLIVKGGTTITFGADSNAQVRLFEYDENKVVIKNTGDFDVYPTYNYTLQKNTRYIKVGYYKFSTNANNIFVPIGSYNCNLIPSSADGSLIFSMYAPSNTVAPASGTWDLKGLEFDNFHTFGMNNDVEQDSEGNISMPARYDDYNITIKNANISPKTHNTMLYPLLVNENNPIEGKLDYTNYEGNNLSWSFAYVNMNKVNIVQPKDELLNTYEYRYNAFYETEYEFDDPNEVLRYITSSSNLLPTFNEGFTYTYDKLDNNDGTYIYRIYANDPTLLTSFELEKVPYLRITNAENLLSPIDLTKYETVSISESYYDITELYFREATNLTLTNMPYLERVIYLPNDEYEVFEIINVVNSKDYIITTSECPRLTTFMTTASHRESYNNEDVIAEVITEFTNTDNELFTNEYVFSKTYWEEDGTEVQGSVNLLHYEIPSIEDSVKAIHMVQGLDSTNRVTFFNDDKFISCEVITTACELDFKLHRDCNRIVFICEREGIVSSVVESILTTTLVKEYGSVEPNIIFNANTLDISNTQFTDVKLLCTTDLNVLKLPTTVKNFYCDSSFDLDTDYLTDGEYDVVHGELVEEYTTDYEDEVVYIKENEVEVLLRDIDTVWKDGYFLNTNGNENSNADRCVSDYIRVVPNTRFILSKDGITQYVNIGALAQYDINKQCITGSNWTNNVTLDTNCAYIRLDHTIAGRDEELLVITFTPYIEYHPNIIPSSADGSLIFSMYAPNKTVQPASNTWDLYGLEFDNFHTYGMNNDVKGELEVKELRNNTTIYRILDERYNSNTLYGLSYGTASGTPGSYSVGCSISPILLDEDVTSITITTSNGCGMFHYNSTDYDGVTATAQGFSGGTTDSGYPRNVASNTRLRLITFHDDTDLKWFDMTLVGNETKTIRYYMEDMIIVDVNDERRKTWNTVSYDTIYETTSLSMPSRYNNYNVTIKNANIKPTTHNTMLYPLLVNEDNPIEGKLDYTDYNGEYLSWSFAYTNTNKVNIIQPKDELLNSYEYRYNAFYRTEYEFDNPNEVMEYTTTSSNLLPIFNEGFTYAYDKIDNDDGTYTYKIYANDISLLTSFELEKVPYLRITNAENLVLPIDLTKYEVIEIDNSYSNITELYFRDTTNLTLSNMSNLERVIYLPNDEYEVFELINVANAPNYTISTFNCPKLSTFMTTAPYRESYNNCGLIEKDRNKTIIFEPKSSLWNGSDYVLDVLDNGMLSTQELNSLKKSTDFMECFSNVEYTLTSEDTGSWVGIVFYDINKNVLGGKGVNQVASNIITLISPNNTSYIRLFSSNGNSYKTTLTYKHPEIIMIKDCGDIQPNTTFTANSIDISNTQFTDVKLLCTTDTNTLKLPTTVKNFYCDSLFDLDTNYLEDGEYDVVHGELVEPYTTDYEGEVCIYRAKENSTLSFDDLTWNPGVLNSTTGLVDNNDSRHTCDEFIPVQGDTDLTTTHETIGFVEYDENKNFLSGISWGAPGRVIHLNANTCYVRFSIYTWQAEDKHKQFEIKYTGLQPYTPNLIPSSADGSLIFSMYAPSNTVAPASGTWDLKGLEFDNFHTFGMNNDVKVIAEKTQNINFDEAIELDNVEFDLNIKLSASAINRGYIRLCDGSKMRIIYFNRQYIAYATDIDSWVFTKLKEDTSSSATKLKLSVSQGILTYYLDDVLFYSTYLNNIPYYNDTIYNKISIELVNDGGFDSIISSKTLTSPSNDINDINSLSMPARYDDYNITIKNANISPKTHNTMLYPLLVNEDKPITGTLDYTNYEGKYLSWSFAYTDEEYVDIIQPKDELINSYKYKYNTYYDTEYEFDNPYEIARYTSSASGVLPLFNKEFTYTYDERANGDGTYTTKIYADSLDNLPIWLSYQDKTNLLSVEKLKTGVLVSAESMFQGCSSLTSVNISEIDVSSVGQIYRMFRGCNKLTEIKGIANLSNGNFTTTWEMFLGCGSLTELDVSGFNTSNVTSMDGMFRGCSGLTSLNLSGFDTGKVNTMGNMFYDCYNLTSLDLSGFDTKNVTNMLSMFRGCRKLTSLDLSGFDTSNVTTMQNMFSDCRGLTSLDASEFDTSNVTNMESMFYNCWSLKEVKGIENWDCSKVDKFGSMFQGATAFGGDLDLRNWKVGQNATVTEIYGFMNGCTNLKSVDMSGWILPDNTNFSNFMNNQGSLHTVKVIGWSAVNIQNICGAIGFYVGGTIYGDIIIDESKLPSGWIYSNSLEVAIYTCSTSGVLPIFNAEFTYTHSETSNEDGTYTTKVVANSLDNLPTKISFNGIDNNVYITALVSVEKLNTSNVTVMSSMFRNCKALTSVNLTGLDISKTTNMAEMFRSCSVLLEIKGIENWDTSNVTNMSSMFQSCGSLTSLDLSGFDTSDVTTMSNMFASCSKLTSLDVSNFDTSKVTNMSGMFDSCSNLTTLDVSNFDTSKVTNMSMMFKNCNKLIALNVSNFDTSKVTNMSEMFFTCGTLSSIEGLGNWDVKNVTDMGNMFLHCRGITSLLEISDWDTSSLKSLYRTFMGCTELIELDVSNWNTSKLEALLETFYGCAKIISFNLGNWDCRRVISISGTFFGCTSLSSITLPKEVGKGCNAVSALKNCTNLKEVALPKGIGNISHMLNNCYNLEKAVIPLDDITDVQDTTFNNCRALVDIDWVGDLSNNFNIIWNTGEHITTESDVHELMTNLGDLKKDKIKISLSKGTIKVNNTEKTIE